MITFGNLKIHSPQITAVYGTSMLKCSPATEKKYNVSREIRERERDKNFLKE